MSLELRGVEKNVLNETHIHTTDLKVERGEFCILLGTTLAGKTTLMQLMAGLERPTAGEIWFDGRNVTGQRVQDRNVSMVYQQFINYPNFTVFENIASPLRVARVPEAEIRKKVGEMAELLHISQMLERRPSELSGGQQQRTAMARAMVKDSDLILLDEPLANLDFKLREELRDELPRLFSQRECVVVYATTEPSEALLFGGKTAALSEGQVVDYGPTGEIYRKPHDLTTAQVFSEPPINVTQVKKAGSRFVMTETVSWSAKGSAASLADGDYTIGIRPHFVSPVESGENRVPIEGTVQVAELSGSESIIHFLAYGNHWISLSHGVHSYDAGDNATLYADMSNCLYFTPNGQLALAGGQNEAAHNG